MFLNLYAIPESRFTLLYVLYIFLKITSDCFVLFCFTTAGFCMFFCSNFGVILDLINTASWSLIPGKAFVLEFNPGLLAKNTSNVLFKRILKLTFWFHSKMINGLVKMELIVILIDEVST